MKTHQPGSLEHTLERLAWRVAAETMTLANPATQDRWTRGDFGRGWTCGTRYTASRDLREILRHARARRDFPRLAAIVRRAIRAGLEQARQRVAA